MKNIVLKSNTDLEKNKNKPSIEDILSLRGFIRYFAYRNTLPGIRDLLYFIIDTAQIYFIFIFINRGAATGGVIGYVSILLISSLWNVMLYSMREKILELESRKQLNLVPNYFAATIFSGFVIWAIMVLAAIVLIRLNTTQGSIIFIGRLLAGSFDLYSSIYFFSTYTLYRIYIPLSYTLLNRLFFLFLPLLFVRYLGGTAFVLAFFAEKTVNSFITVKFCNKTLRAKGMNLVTDNFTKLLVKKSFWFVRENPLGSIKRALSSSLFSLQKFIVILLIHSYYNFYLIDFFVFYQMIHLFMLVPLRISKSMYHDITLLLYGRKYYLLRILFNYNMALSLLFAVLSVYVFSIIPSIPVPQRIYSMVFEFILLDKWKDLYPLIFFSYGISLINRLLFVSEAHLWLISTSLFFDYFLLGALLLFSPYFLKLGNPMLFFSFQGRLSLFYFITLLTIYLSGLWKKESVLTKIRDHSTADLGYMFNRKDFTSLIKKNNESRPVILMVTLSKTYADSSFINGIIELALERLEIKAVTRFSNNTLFFLMNNSARQSKELELSILSILGVYSDKIIISTPDKLMWKVFSTPIINLIYPKLYSAKDEVDISPVLNDKEYTELLTKALKDADNNYIEHSIYLLKNSTRKKEVTDLFSLMNRNYSYFPENTIMKKEHLGLIPLITAGKTEKIFEVYITAEPSKIKAILRIILMRDLYLFLSEMSNG